MNCFNYKLFFISVIACKMLSKTGRAQGLTLEGCGQPVPKNEALTVCTTIHTNWMEGHRTVSGNFNPQ